MVDFASLAMRWATQLLRFNLKDDDPWKGVRQVVLLQLLPLSRLTACADLGIASHLLRNGAIILPIHRVTSRAHSSYIFLVLVQFDWSLTLLEHVP